MMLMGGITFITKTKMEGYDFKNQGIFFIQQTEKEMSGKRNSQEGALEIL